MKYSRMTPEGALKARAGMDLDVFLFEYIFDGVLLPGDDRIPSFSRSLGSSKMLLVKMMSQNPGLVVCIEWGPEHFVHAVKAGYLYDGAEIPVWMVHTNIDLHAYGRTLEEAICKLSILEKMRDPK